MEKIQINDFEFDGLYFIGTSYCATSKALFDLPYYILFSYFYTDYPREVGDFSFEDHEFIEKYIAERELLKLAKFLVDSRIVAASKETILELTDPLFEGKQYSRTVLIFGERGSGKESMAALLHKNGPRKNKPFVAINCAAISTELFEYEMYGHVEKQKGKKPKRKRGYLDEANGGVLFMDEISTLSVRHQQKFLRFLQEGTFKPVGSEKDCKADVFVCTATNADLWKMVEDGEFREDFYDRISGAVVEVPNLSDRQPADKKALVLHFISSELDESFKNGKLARIHIPIELFDILWKVPYSGNIREMQHRCKNLAYNHGLQLFFYLMCKEMAHSKESDIIDKGKRIAEAMEVEKEEYEEFVRNYILLREMGTTNEIKLWKYSCIASFLNALSPGTIKNILGLKEKEEIPDDFRKYGIAILLGILLPKISKKCASFAIQYQQSKGLGPYRTDVDVDDSQRVSYSYDDLIDHTPYQKAKSELINKFEKDWVEHVAEKHDGVKDKEIARRCGMHETSFNKLKKRVENRNMN